MEIGKNVGRLLLVLLLFPVVIGLVDHMMDSHVPRWLSQLFKLFILAYGQSVLLRIMGVPDCVRATGIALIVVVGVVLLYLKTAQPFGTITTTRPPDGSYRQTTVPAPIR